MRKFNKAVMIIVSILLALVMLSSCLVSGVLARYTASETAKADIGFKKLGLSVTSGTDLSSSYTLKVGDDEIAAVQSTQNVIAPGTHGCLAWVRVKGTPEVNYDLDFSGSFSIGDGYYASSGLIKNASGTAIDYFPLALYFVAYKVTKEENGVLTLGSEVKRVRICHSRSEGGTRRYFSGGTFGHLNGFVSVVDNGVYDNGDA